MEEKITFRLNGKTASVTTDSHRKLLWVLRTDLGLTGTKFGCGEAYCGACTVIIDGAAARSCQTALRDVQGKSVTTIEGLSHDGKLHPVQDAFARNDALQCGYCTSGMIMTAVAFLNSHPHPTTADIISGMEDNLCRCGAHNRIITAIQAAAKEM